MVPVIRAPSFTRVLCVLSPGWAFGIRFVLYKANAHSRVISPGSGRFETLQHYDEMIPDWS